MNSKTLIHKKQRLDALLVALNIAETRSRAQQFIRGGHVRVDGKMCTKSGTLMQEELSIEVDKNAIPCVSRGGIKLAYALSVFNIDVTAKVCLDIGASTGGFTDCLLKHGGKFVYAIDVGHGQLHSSLRDNPHVSYIEGIDIRAFHLPKNKLVDLICIDISFISLTLVLPVVKRFLFPNGEVIILIKPQFEVGPGIVNKKGVVKNRIAIYEALNKVLTFAQECKLFPIGLTASPIQGKEGNIEYLAYLTLDSLKRFYTINDLIEQLRKKEGNKDEEDEKTYH